MGKFDIYVFICFLTLFSQSFIVTSAKFELNMPCFFIRIEKEEECQNLLFLASSVKVGLYLQKPGTKEKKLKNDVRKLYLRNHEKARTSWLNFREDMKKKVRRKSWTLGRFFRKMAARSTCMFVILPCIFKYLIHLVSY